MVVSIWMNTWCGCLRPPCGRHRSLGALEDLQQRLLNAFAGNVARDRRVLALCVDLGDLVDVDDARLGALDVEVGGLDQLERMFSTSSPTYPASVSAVASATANGTLSIRAGFCARWVLAAPGRPKQDVRLRQRRVVARPSPTSAGTGSAWSGCRGDRGLLRLFLDDDVVVEERTDVARVGRLSNVSARSR